MKIQFGLLLSLMVLLTACSQGFDNSIPEGIIAPEQMKPILLDIHLADAIGDNAGEKGKDASATAKQYNKAVFAKHKIKPEQFYQSMRFYETHPAVMDKMYEELMVEMSKTNAKVKAGK